MVNPRSRAAIENIDVAAATFVVGDDLQVSDFLTLAEALINLPPEGGTIFCLTSFSTADTLSMPDKDVTIIWAAGATWSYTGAGVAIDFPDIMTAVRRFVFSQMTPVGDGVNAQTFMQFNATTPPFVWIRTAMITGFKTIFDIQAGDVTYANPLTIYNVDSTIIPPGIAGQTLSKSAQPWGVYAIPIGIFFIRTNAALLSDTNPTFQWGGDFAGDWILDTSIIATGATRIYGLTTFGPCAIFGAAGVTLEVGGAAYYSTDNIGNVWLTNGLILKIDVYWAKLYDITLNNGSSISLNDDAIEVSGIADIATDPGVNRPAAAIDVLAGADHCSIVHCTLRWATVSLVRNGAQGIRVNSNQFLADGAVKTIADVGAGNFTLGVGNQGVSSGGGLALAAGSKVTIGDYNFA